MFIGNAYGYISLSKWLSQALPDKLDSTCVCVVHGPSGCGKTHGILKAIAESKRIVCKVEDKDAKSYIIKMTTSDIVSQFENVSLSDKVVFIDELEMFTSLDRGFVNGLLALYNTMPAVKIIIAGTAVESKLIEKSLYIRLTPVPDADMIVFLRSVYTKVKPAIILDIIQSCKGNLGAAINAINGPGVSYIDKQVSALDIYSSTNARVVLGIVSTDPWLVPLRYHENMIHELKQRKGTTVVKNTYYLRFLQGLCNWDSMISHAKVKGDTDIIPSEYISRVITTTNTLARKKNSENVDNFTKLFNSLSLRKKKRVQSYQSVFPWQHLSGFYRDISTTKKFSGGSISANGSS